MKLQDHEYVVIYKPGRYNANADALSRNPLPKGVLPISGVPKTDSDSEDSIFSFPQTQRANSPQTPAPDTPPENHTPGNEPPSIQGRPSTYASGSSSDYDENDGNDIDDDLSDNVNEQYEIRETIGKPIEIPDNFTLRRDTLTIFTSSQVSPATKENACSSKKANYQLWANLLQATPSVTKTKSQTMISLPIEDKVSEILEEGNLLRY